MDPGDVAIFIPFFALSIPIVAIWTRHQRKMVQLKMSTVATETAERAAQYANQVQTLEERVRVLERIVTDGGYDTAAQIEALRDSRSISSGTARETVVSPVDGRSNP